MSDFFELISDTWELLFGWLPTPLDIFCTLLVGILVVVLLIKIIAFILDAIPFL